MSATGSARAGKKSHYRMDIQGIRGIAVLLVVLFHAEILFFSGGFIGVDVFFVLSGFVIAQVLLRELQKTGKIDLKRFYERRFRRLLPAAAVVSVVVMMGSVILLSPTGPQQFALRTSMAAALFLSNIYLYRGGGYFEPTLESNPFLHMWSLSVEEQFYFLLPMTMAIVWALVKSRKKRAVAAVVLAGGLGSFVLSVALVLEPELFPFRAHEFGFFFPFTRIWEFAAGVLLALGASRIPRLGNKMALWWALMGVTFIVLASVFLDSNTGFPGWTALFPVMGTVLLLVAGDNSELVAKMLSWTPLRWMGDLSYSWYLWHWPLIVFAPVVFPDAGHWLLPVVGFGSLLPAWLSYRYLEDPIRRNRALVGRKAWGLAAACMGSVLLLGVALNVGASNKWGLEIPAGWTEVSIGHERACDGFLDDSAREECTFFAEDSTPSPKGSILLLGDSHASALSDGVIDAAHREGYDVIVRWMPSCPFFKDRPVVGYQDCAIWQDFMVELIEREKPTLVIMSVYASNYILSPHHRPDRVVMSATGREAKTQQEALQSWADALEGTLRYFEDQEIPVIAMSPVPFYKRDFTQWISLYRPDPEIPTFTRDEVQVRQEAGQRINQGVVSTFEGARLFDPLQYICDDEICAAAGDEGWYYRDDSHINAAGSMRLSPGLQRTIREALQHSESRKSAPGPREEVR